VQNYPQFGSINLKCLQRHFELQRPTGPCGTPLGQPADHRTQKNLHLTERVNLELHGDAFNVFNTPQFNNPGSNLDDPYDLRKADQREAVHESANPARRASHVLNISV
jgi:hypothetical protein